MTAVVAVASRNGPRNSAPTVPDPSENGTGENSSDSDDVNPQSAAQGKNETTASRIVVGVTNARGACRRVLRSAEPWYAYGLSLTVYSARVSREKKHWRGGKKMAALRSVVAVAGVWASRWVRSKDVSGAPRAMAGMATTKKALRIVGWRENPDGPWEVTPPIKGGPQVVAMVMTE